MIRVSPLAARLVAIIWVLAGLSLGAAGAVTILMGGSLARWELPVALALGALGVSLWRHEIAVDDDGVEQRRGGQRSRLLWSAVSRVEVPVGRALAGPVLIWRQDADHPDTLPGSWGLSRGQGLRLAQAIRSVTTRYDIVVEGADDPGSSTLDGQDADIDR